MFKPPDLAHICLNPVDLIKNMNRFFTTDAGFAHQRADGQRIQVLPFLFRQSSGGFNQLI